jgi:DNA-binding response OmpR family regulator
MDRGRLLLIEDDAHIAEALQFILSRDGWAVSVHSDGQDALQRIAEASPDLVVLDVMLPGRSGLEVLADLRNDAALKSLPVLILSASGQSVAAAEAELQRAVGGLAGPTQVMTKPFANAAVIAAARELAGP